MRHVGASSASSGRRASARRTSAERPPEPSGRCAPCPCRVSLNALEDRRMLGVHRKISAPLSRPGGSRSGRGDQHLLGGDAKRLPARAPRRSPRARPPRPRHHDGIGARQRGDLLQRLSPVRTSVAAAGNAFGLQGKSTSAFRPAVGDRDQRAPNSRACGSSALFLAAGGSPRPRRFAPRRRTTSRVCVADRAPVEPSTTMLREMDGMWLGYTVRHSRACLPARMLQTRGSRGGSDTGRQGEDNGKGDGRASCWGCGRVILIACFGLGEAGVFSANRGAKAAGRPARPRWAGATWFLTVGETGEPWSPVVLVAVKIRRVAGRVKRIFVREVSDRHAGSTIAQVTAHRGRRQVVGDQAQAGRGPQAGLRQARKATRCRGRVPAQHRAGPGRPALQLRKALRWRAGKPDRPSKARPGRVWQARTRAMRQTAAPARPQEVKEASRRCAGLARKTDAQPAARANRRF
jgi:hypothetical protein